MTTDTSKFIPADRLSLEQQPIDMKAPILLRPLGDDPKDKRNWVLKAIERTGQSLDVAITTWAFGFALEDDLMWNATVEYKGEEEARRHYDEVWRRIPEKYHDAAQKVFTRKSDEPPYGPVLEIGADEIASRLELSKEDALVLWNRGFTGHDHQMWRVWEDFYGAREGVIMYSRVWEGFALGFLDVIKGVVGMQEFKTTDDLARLNRAYWEAIGCEVEDVEQTDDRLVAIIKTCPYFDNMVDMYGKEAASEMMKKTIGPTSANYYQALMKALGLWDTFFVTQDQFRSLGDSRLPDGLRAPLGAAAGHGRRGVVTETPETLARGRAGRLGGALPGRPRARRARTGASRGHGGDAARRARAGVPRGGGRGRRAGGGAHARRPAGRGHARAPASRAGALVRRARG